ncbi:MAG: DUF1648 domain-containing protein [Ruthenibacterium lactatiformans]
MKQSNKTEWAIWGVCALSFAVTLALLPLLPARIPVHWNVDGQIDGWAARPGAFFGPAMGLGLSLLMKFLPYIDPRRRSYESSAARTMRSGWRWRCSRLSCRALRCTLRFIRMDWMFPASLPPVWARCCA